MANTNNKIRIQRALMVMGREAPYYPVKYDADGLPVSIDSSEGGDQCVAPVSVGANELKAGFGVDARHRRAYVGHRESWLWALLVAFQGEVTSHRAEESWLTKPPVLSAENGMPQVILDLVDANYEHPVRSGGSSGSRVTFMFEARLGRR